jgi:hypothetical protein
MGRFLRHEPCPACGSRDNLARYDDGSAFCWGCRRYESRTTIPNRDIDQSSDSRTLFLPRSCTTDFPTPCTEWLGRYSITIAECLARGAVWEPAREQFILPYFSEEGELVCYQARNFNPYRANKSKYYNVGSKETAFPLIQNHGPVVSLTEDTLSAIKVARQVAAMPLLGVHIQVKKLIRLKQLGFETVIVWLDQDKWREARDISDLCKWAGVSSRAILTEKDPKEYSDEEIKEYLK